MSTNISRHTDTLTTGHGCDTITTLAIPGQTDVFAEGLLVARIGDPTVVHLIPCGCPPCCCPHVAYVNNGSSTVFCHGIGVAGKMYGEGWSTADLGVMTEGAPTVFAGDGTGP